MKKSPSKEFDLNRLSEVEQVAVLASGEHAAALGGYFGDVEYDELHKLARRSVRLRGAGRTRVYILPGIMGSMLGYRRKSGNHVVWLDPIPVAAGELLSLALPDTTAIQPLGVMLPGYLKLKLLLRLAGFDAVFHPFDWRKSVAINGQLLLQRIARDNKKKAAIVGHSMGGLVARAALAVDRGKRLGKIVQLGAPNFGSFAPVQALRAVYGSVRKVAALDPEHSAEQLSRHVFRSLPGIYELLPSPLHRRDADLFELQSWPDDLLGPDATMLAQARRVRERLGAARAGCYHIIGINRETVIGAAKQRSGFQYRLSLDGDGTVPRSLAEWPGAQNLFVDEQHGCLTKNNVIAAAIADLLTTGHTRRIAHECPIVDNPVVRRVSDAQLRDGLRGKMRWQQLSGDQQRKILDPTISNGFRSATARLI